MQHQICLALVTTDVETDLEQMRVGGQLDFNQQFSDVLPAAADRQAVLMRLKAAPKFVSGAVDVTRGIIYRASSNPLRRAASYLWLLFLALPLAWVFTTLVTKGSAQLGVSANMLLQGSRQGELWTAYLFVLAGAVLHVLIEAEKQNQRSTTDSFLAMGDWLTWIHVRETSLTLSILAAWCVPLGLALSLGGTVSWQTALFAGYSIDSVIGLFITRFDGVASKSSTALFSRLQTSAPAPQH